MSISIRRLTGVEIQQKLNDIARLRIEVFQEFPYLYEGTAEYEVKYLSKYITSKKAAIIGVFDENSVVGVATCLPLQDEDMQVQKAFQNSEFDIHKIFYFSESVLQKKYRGKGLGKAIFQEREKWVGSFGEQFNLTTFCAVERPLDHALRPENYCPLDEFWKSQGYTKHPEVGSEFSWKDIGQTAETFKQMTFWLKRWSNDSKK